MNLFELKDAKCVPDIVQEYPDYVKRASVPLIIDNGRFLHLILLDNK